MIFIIGGREQTCTLQGATGVHDLVFCFRGGEGMELFNWDSWELRK